MFILGFVIFGALQMLVVQARPIRRSTTKLTAADIEQYTPFTHWVGAASCPASATQNWTCGVHCDAHPGFNTTASGGDGDKTPFWFVGFDPDLQSVIIGHQGTDFSKAGSRKNDFDADKVPADSNLFPGLPKGVEVHEGFRDAHARSATDVLTAVKTTMSTHSTNKIVTVGWSQGGAISLLEGVHLHLTLPQADVSVYGYGMPRVGNQEWADFVDQSMPGKITRITNQDDPVPTLPGRFLPLSFHHVSGERHITNDGSWVFCSGQDNTDSQCSTGQLKFTNLGHIDPHDHAGPYNGIFLTCNNTPVKIPILDRSNA
ncbi:Alpha/Beta hydrolase protein [Flagelloscypha sp. PMI_526]|nr:Alpha/Beta hydrolase protein [Flagelloscypha sp. PMI_526]